MLAADPKILQRLEPHLRRILIADPNPAAARLLAELMKGLGTRDVFFESDERRILELARETDPQILFTERAGPRLDGESLTKKLRRSHLQCRKAPVIMVTADATASTIKGARDAGVHEFMRKPFTAGDLLKRVAVVIQRPRDWIEAVQYVGPDRRRFNSGDYSGPLKRRADKGDGSDAKAAATDQAMRILKAALAQFDSDPQQALRAMRDQGERLKVIAVQSGQAPLAVAVATLEIALTGAPTREALAGPIGEVVKLCEVPAAPAQAVA